ncbi:MAG TPA: hypothetical protein VMJ64_17860 [Anaerolineales bacterium]|nr:hypothetical protein [Anaerolineales bacterium]
MNLPKRILGTLLLRPAAFREIAENSSVVESAALVAGLALLNGLA